MMDTFNGALTLNQSRLHALRDSPDVVRRGLLVLLLVGLLVGGVDALQSLLSRGDPERQANDFAQQYDEFVDQMGLSANTPEIRETVQALDENRDAIVDLVREVSTLPSPLPRPVSLTFQAFGIWLSRPTSYLWWLLVAVIFTQIAARQLGGEGSIQQMLGLGALSSAPHALDALGFIPGLGSALQLIAFFWGLAILISATAIAHRLDSGRATIAVLLYPLIASLLVLLGCCGYALLLAVLANAG